MSSLSPRDVKMLGMLAYGRSAVEIAAALHLSEHAVKSAIAKIYRVMGVHSSRHAVGVAYRARILTVPREEP